MGRLLVPLVILGSILGYGLLFAWVFIFPTIGLLWSLGLLR